MTKVLHGLQYVRTLEDLYREGDPSIPLRFDNTDGIKTMNSVFYRRNQAEMDDSNDSLLLEQLKKIRHQRMASNTGMAEDQVRMLEDRGNPQRAITDGINEPVPMDVDEEDLLAPSDTAHPVVQEAVAEAVETHKEEISRRAQFAQAASSGLSAASGAAESMISHTASALKLIPRAAGAARDIIGEEAEFWGPNGPVAGVAAHGLIMAGQQARKNQIEYNGYASQAWDKATPATTALKEWLIGKPPSLIAEPTPEQAEAKRTYLDPLTTPSSSSSAAPPLDFNVHIFGPKAGMPRSPPEPKSKPLALKPPSGLDVATSKPKSRTGPNFPGVTYKRGPT